MVSIIAALALIGCKDDETPVNEGGNVSFVVSGSGLGAGRKAGIMPEKLVVSVEDEDGRAVFNDRVLDLTSSDHGFVTAIFPFGKGTYRVTKYLVISGETATWATPKAGAQKASLISQPLPLEFTVTPNELNEITPNIVGISSQDVPQNFGYSDFGYNLPEDPSSAEWMSVRVKLEMTLGSVFYPNIDADFTVKAYNEANVEMWKQDFRYIGPEANDLKIKNGFHHYTFEAKKWGKVLTQTFLMQGLWDSRVREGVVPTTYVFQATTEAKKIASYITSSIGADGDGGIKIPVNKVTHVYENGRISRINYSTWVKLEARFVDQSHSEFIYEGNKVKRIVTYNAGEAAKYTETTYTYDAEGYASHIQHKSLESGGITTDVELSHLYGDRLVKAVYSLSNGTGFEYEFENKYGNMKSDKTTRGAQLCSLVNYTSDKNINPFKHLGYTDYLLRNYSVSNRLTEDAVYVGCAFPSRVAESYDYLYDQDGYPLRATTNYKGTSAKTEVEYTYVD